MSGSRCSRALHRTALIGVDRLSVADVDCRPLSTPGPRPVVST